MKFVDTHTHLYVEQFDEDRKEVIQKAIDAGVDQFYLPAIDKSYHQAMLTTKKLFPNKIKLMTGLHPCHVTKDFHSELEFVREQAKSRDYIAIGEIGIDLYWDKTLLKEQQEAFKAQIQISKNHHLPIAIHCRDAFDEVFEVLQDEFDENLKGVFHCFTGNLEQAKKAISYNLHLGIGGVATFKNGKIDKFLNQIPLEHILLETDAPYLAPTPYRGKRNESAYIPLIADKLSDIYQISVEDIALQTTKNALDLFE
ncbi:MAG: TatD family hydrolase [Flavobacteriaceae bacterium]